MHNQVKNQYSGCTFFVVSLFLLLIRILWLKISNLELYGDEAQYWVWSKHLSFGYYSKPPVVAWLIALTTTIGDDSTFYIRLSSPILHFINGLLVYCIAQELFQRDKVIAFWSGIVYLTMPAVFLSSMLISTDPAFLMCWSLALYAFIKAIRSDELKWWCLSGVASGCGMLSKYSMLLFLASVLAYLLYTKKFAKILRNKGFWIALLLAGIIYLPNLIWNVENSMSNYKHTLDNATGGIGNGLYIISFIEFFLAQFGVFGPIIFACFLYRLLWIKKDMQNDSLRILLIFSLLFLGTILMLAFVSRAHANWAAPAYIGISIYTVYHLVKNNQMALIKLSVGLHLLIGSIALLYQPIVDTFNISLTAQTDPFKRLRGGRELGAKLDQIKQEYPDTITVTDGRRELALFTYYTCPHDFNIIKWNSSHRLNDHFELTTNLNNYIGKDLLIITNNPNIEGYRRFGRNIRELEDLSVKVYDDHLIGYHVYLLREFQGY